MNVKEIYCVVHFGLLFISFNEISLKIYFQNNILHFEFLFFFFEYISIICLINTIKIYIFMTFSILGACTFTKCITRFKIIVFLYKIQNSYLIIISKFCHYLTIILIPNMNWKLQVLQCPMHCNKTNP